MVKQQGMLLSLFPSAVLTASGSKGISQHKAPLKFFVNLYNFLLKEKYKKNPGCKGTSNLSQYKYKHLMFKPESYL